MKQYVSPAFYLRQKAKNKAFALRVSHSPKGESLFLLTFLFKEKVRPVLIHLKRIG